MSSFAKCLVAACCLACLGCGSAESTDSPSHDSTWAVPDDGGEPTLREEGP